MPSPADDTPDGAAAGPGTGRSAAAEAAALALASGSTVRAAAKRAGIGERTLYAWLNRSAFKAKVSRLRSRLVDTALGQLSKDMTAAAAVLRKLLKADDENVRLRAARAVIELGVALRQTSELADRVEQLESRLADKNGKV